MKTIAVLITVHNRREKTLRCLDYLFGQDVSTGYALKVYLTDDGCTDGTPEAVRERFPQVKIVPGDGTLFWNRGMIAAWKAAAATHNYDFYLWLNDDTYLLPGAITAMIAETEEKPGCIIVGTTKSNDDKRDATYGGYVRRRLMVPNGTLRKCDSFNGNIVIVPRNVFNSLGVMDSAYTHAMGDLDYGYMARRAGFDIYLSGDFRGVCNKNAVLPKWMRAEVPFAERWRNFHSPLGYAQPKVMFHFNKKNFGLARAVRVWLTNHFRVCFPFMVK